MNVYKCLAKSVYEKEGYKLTTLREEDIFLIKDWRNAQIDVLRQKNKLTDEDQTRYYKSVVAPEFDKTRPSQILFSLLYEQSLIGYGGLVHISWEDKRAEVSFLVNPERALNDALYAKDFGAYLSLIKSAAYDDLKFNRLFTETYDIRPYHVSILEQNGFILEGRLRKHNFIQGKYVDSLIHGNLNEYGS